MKTVVVEFASGPIAETAARRFRYRVQHVDVDRDPVLAGVVNVRKRGRNVEVDVLSNGKDMRRLVAERVMLAAGTVASRVSYP